MKAFLVLLLTTAISGAVVPSPSNRIVGGGFVQSITQFPYQVALFEIGQFKCGGSIIAEKWVLTAAHCITQLDGSITPIDNLKLQIGSTHLHLGGKAVKPSKIIPHEDYPKIRYDIALIELKEPLVFDETIQKLELYRGDLPVNATVTISGHGKTGNDEPISEMLKFNTMMIMSEEDCLNEMVNSGWKNIICLNNAADNGACTGDSGSAAVYEGKQIGVANFVRGNCGTIKPDGYAFVPFFIDWIEKIMAE